VPEGYSATGSTVVAGPARGSAGVVLEPGNPASLHGAWPQPSFNG
jgi:hypothetical protein